MSASKASPKKAKPVAPGSGIAAFFKPKSDAPKVDAAAAPAVVQVRKEPFFVFSRQMPNGFFWRVLCQLRAGDETNRRPRRQHPTYQRQHRRKLPLPNLPNPWCLPVRPSVRPPKRPPRRERASARPPLARRLSPPSPPKSMPCPFVGSCACASQLTLRSAVFRVAIIDDSEDDASMSQASSASSSDAESSDDDRKARAKSKAKAKKPAAKPSAEPQAKKRKVIEDDDDVMVVEAPAPVWLLLQALLSPHGCFPLSGRMCLCQKAAPISAVAAASARAKADALGGPTTAAPAPKPAPVAAVPKTKSPAKPAPPPPPAVAPTAFFAQAPTGPAPASSAAVVTSKFFAAAVDVWETSYVVSVCMPSLCVPCQSRSRVCGCWCVVCVATPPPPLTGRRRRRRWLLGRGGRRIGAQTQGRGRQRRAVGAAAGQ